MGNIITPQSYIDPSFKQGYAKGAGESATPALWKGIKHSTGFGLGDTGSKRYPDLIVGSMTGYNNSTAPVPARGFHGVGSSLLFNGIDSSISFADPVQLRYFDRITIAGWIRLTSAAGLGNISDKDNNSSPRCWQFRVNSGKIEFIVWNEISTLATATGATTMTAGEDYHVSGTWDGVTIKVYVNGKLDGSGALAGGAVNAGSILTALGSRSSTGAQFFNGAMGNIIHWGRALNIGSIKQLAKDPMAPFRLRSKVITRAAAVVDPDTTADSGTTELPMLWMNNPQVIEFPILTMQGYADMGGDLTFPVLAVTSSGTAGEASGAFDLPLLWMNNPQIIEFPILTVDAVGSLDTNNGLLALPLLWMSNPHTIALPLFTVSATDGANQADLELPMFTVSSEQQAKGSGEVSLPMFATNTVAQQGFVHSVFVTMPALSLTAYTGHDIDLTMPMFTMDNSGNNAGLASFNQSLPRMGIVVKGKQLETGIARLFLPEFNLSASLLTGIISVSGGNRTLPIFTTNLHAYRGENGDGAMSMPIFTTATQAVDNPQCTLAQNLKMFTLDAFADQYTNRII